MTFAHVYKTITMSVILCLKNDIDVAHYKTSMHINLFS